MTEATKLWAVELVPIDDVQPHPENYREWDVGAIAVSIERLGYFAPVVVQRSTGFIVAGSGRWTALKALGRTEVPVRFMDWSDTEARSAMLADNFIPRRARDMDQELLDLMVALRREDEELWQATGVEDEDVEALERELAEADKPLKLSDPRPKPKKRPVVCPACGERFTPEAKP
jgi:ParB-like chromosome segregation protein Spo0J